MRPVFVLIGEILAGVLVYYSFSGLRMIVLEVLLGMAVSAIGLGNAREV